MGVGAACGIVLAAMLTRSGRSGQRVSAVLATVATLVALALTLTPDKSANTAVTCSFEPFFFFNDIFNMVLFFLPVLFAVIAIRRPLIGLAGGIGLSMVIETVQATTLFLGRRCDINDWLANSTGTLFGVLAGTVVIALIRPAGDPRQTSIGAQNPATQDEEAGLDSVTSHDRVDGGYQI